MYRKAYEYLEENGWVKGELLGPNESACMLGACSRVGVSMTQANRDLAPILEEQYPDRMVEAKKMEPSMFEVAAFNDHPDTTLDDVRVVFEKAEIRKQEHV